MAAWDGSAHSEGRGWNASPRSKARGAPAMHAASSHARAATENPTLTAQRAAMADSAKAVLCRNVTIYGYCRHEKDGCPYNHNTNKTHGHSSQLSSGSLKQRFNVESPAFTPGVGADTVNVKKAGFSPRALSAAPFTPKSVKPAVNTAPQPRHPSSEWSNQDIQEFIPQGYHNPQLTDVNTSLGVPEAYNAYDGASSYGDLENAQSAQYNPYVHDPSSAAAAAGPGGPTIYNQQSTYAQPLNYHLYAPAGPYRESLLPYQRMAHDFFVPEDLRQQLQRQTEATLQSLPNSSLPPSIEHFHSLVPLDTGTQKNTTAFGYNTWLYKAQSSKDGNFYALRRIEGFRLTSEKAIRSVHTWKRIASASCVTVHDCFTTRAFGDSSLIFITDYHPTARTLLEVHFPGQSGLRGVRPPSASAAPESTLWGYLVQLASALRAIHSNGLAARLVHPSKILVTSKNRLRLNANAILDVVQPRPDGTPIQLLHHEDLQQLGRLVLALATATPNPNTFMPGAAQISRALEGLARSHGQRLATTVAALLDAGSDGGMPDAATLAVQLADHTLAAYDASLNAEDAVTSMMGRELENARLARLLLKMGFVNERPEYNPHEPSSASVNSGATGGATAGGGGPASAAALQRGAWSETGDRFYLKLFRDYVFHQVGQPDGRPVVDLAHALSCLNKLDAGSDERIALVSRDEQSVIVVTYREVKRGLERAFAELRTATSAPAQPQQSAPSQPQNVHLGQPGVLPVTGAQAAVAMAHHNAASGPGAASWR